MKAPRSVRFTVIAIAMCLGRIAVGQTTPTGPAFRLLPQTAPPAQSCALGNLCFWYNSTTGKFQLRKADGTDGDPLGGGSAGGAAGGDLTGTYPDPTIAKLQGRTLTITAPADGDTLVWANSLNKWINFAAVLSITPGVGIGVNTSGSNVTISNAGVTSLSATSPIAVDGAVGDLTLSCSTCITGSPTATGDLLYSTAGGQAQTKLADVSAGSFLRSGGVGAAPAWSTTKWTNSATTGDLVYASASNTYSNLADVAAGSYLRSGGTTTAPLWSTLVLPNAAWSPYIDATSVTTAVIRNRARRCFMAHPPGLRLPKHRPAPVVGRRG